MYSALIIGLLSVLICIVMLLHCGEPERIEISARFGRLLAAALTFSLLLHGGVHFPGSVLNSNMNISKQCALHAACSVLTHAVAVVLSAEMS